MNPQKQKSYTPGWPALMLWLLIIAILFALFFYQRNRSTAYAALHSGEHILMLLPDMPDDELSAFQAEARKLADRYNLRIETLRLPTVSAQKQMLALVPQTDVDAVLLWAVSNMDGDYAVELVSCREAGIPVVLIGCDFENKDLRNSFVGSGIRSELMVINQTMTGTSRTRPIVLGNYSHTSGGEVYELLVMRGEENPSFDPSVIRSERLKAFVVDHPTDYFASQYLQATVEANSGGMAALNLKLMDLLESTGPVALFFSLDESLTEALAVLAEAPAVRRNRPERIIGYGSGSELEAYVDSGVINELIVSNTLYSSSIGLRYLHDILLGFSVPSTLDSGVKLIT